MDRMQVEVDGITTVLEAGRAMRIGRSPDADILLAGETVSRKHAELRPTPRGWVLVDVGSQHGTYVNGHRIREHQVTSPVGVYCGLPGLGSGLGLVPELDPPLTQSAPGLGAPTITQPLEPGGLDPTVAMTMAAAPVPPAAPSLTGPDVLVEAGGVHHRFAHPTSVLVGQHPDCAVVVANPAASRHHGRLDPVPGGWNYTNLSREGTFVDGRRTERFSLEDRVTVLLGHPVAGPEIVLTPLYAADEAERRIARRRRRRRLVLLLALVSALVALAAITAAAITLLGDQDPAPAPVPEASDRLTEAELDTAKLATVLIYAQGETESGRPVAWSGSGSLISPGGLILTNAHVAEPQAPGLEARFGPVDLGNPKYLRIALITSADDTPADPAYRARVVESDGDLDASILEIYATTSGQPIADDLVLPTVPLGNSDFPRTGDDVTILGFPGISGSHGVSVTRGVISTFVSNPRAGEERAEIDTDARIFPGNSGGLAIDNSGELVGIPSALYTERGSIVASGRLLPINLIRPMIERAQGK